MKRLLLSVCLLAAVEATAFDSISLSAGDFAIATGKPSLVTWHDGTAYVPVWSLSGGTAGQSVVAQTPSLPAGCAGVRIELLVAVEDPSVTNGVFTDVFRVNTSQIAAGERLGWRNVIGPQVRTALPDAPGKVRRIVVESYRRVTPGYPLLVRVQREPDDPGDTFVRPVGLVAAEVIPLPAPEKVRTVESSPGYNSWPMMQALGKRLVCAYSRGSGHSIGEGARGVYARSSDDGGRTWSSETAVATDPACGEVTIGKGLDEDGAMLLWVRCLGGPKSHHDLYRTTDGVKFERIASPALSPFPMQITDVFKTPSGLMALWFATDYKNAERNAWGTLVSRDNGVTWEQRTVESGMPMGELPTEPSAVHLGGGRILAIARTEGGPTSEFSQFQLTSTDGGVTWRKERTNIRDVCASTPSLILDPASGRVTNYYYERGKGVLKRRIAKAETIFDRPCDWPPAEAVAFGDEDRPWDAGNVNATFIGNVHYLAFYHGTRTTASVCVVPAPAP